MAELRVLDAPVLEPKDHLPVTVVLPEPACDVLEDQRDGLVVATDEESGSSAGREGTTSG